MQQLTPAAGCEVCRDLMMYLQPVTRPETELVKPAALLRLGSSRSFRSQARGRRQNLSEVTEGPGVLAFTGGGKCMTLDR